MSEEKVSWPNPPMDFLTEVQKGNIAGHSMVHKFGRNDTIANGAWELISLASAAPAFRSSAATVRIKAGGNAADDSGGAGATEVTVQGIDSNFAEISEAITTNGASVSSATSASFWRVHRAWVSAVGTYGVANTGIITIEDSGGAADMINIAAGEGQTQHTCWSVPAGKTAYLLSVHVTVDSTQPIDVRCLVRKTFDDVSADMPSKRIKLYWAGLAEAFRYKPNGPELSIPEKSDIWFEAKGAGGAAKASCNFELLVVDD